MPATTVSWLSFGQFVFKFTAIIRFIFTLFRVVNRAAVPVDSERPSLSTFQACEPFRRQGLLVI
jgi:hypothetical protein